MRLAQFLAIFLISLLLFATPTWGVGTWTCSEDEDFGSLGDFEVMVIAGTAGIPAKFVDFVTADRAGEAVLLAAIACTTNHTLAYQVRPVEFRALQISFVLNGTSAGAGDTLDVTGTDWRDAAQLESINVAAGDGTYTGAKYWRTITDIDCTGWADGTLRVTQPQWGFIWDFDPSYMLGSVFLVGNDADSTYFQSTNELVYFNPGYYPVVETNATLTLGEKTGDWTVNGSYWVINATVNNTNIAGGGTWNIYNSKLHNGQSARLRFNFGNVIVINSSFNALDNELGGGDALFQFDSSLTNLEMTDVYISNVWGSHIYEEPSVSEDIRVHDTDWGMLISAQQVTVKDALVTIFDSFQVAQLSGGDYSSYVQRNPKSHVTSLFIRTANQIIYEDYSFDLTIVDKAGSPLSGVTVIVKNVNGDEMTAVDSGTEINGFVSGTYTSFPVLDGSKLAIGQKIRSKHEFMEITNIVANTITVTRGIYTDLEPIQHTAGDKIYIVRGMLTDVNGQIDTIYLIYKNWISTIATERSLSPYTVTLTKAGKWHYELSDVTVDAPINWRFEMESGQLRDSRGKLYQRQSDTFIIPLGN